MSTAETSPAETPDMITSLSPTERETTVTVSDGDESVHIWTAQRRVITRLRKDPLFTLVASGFHGTTAWAAFTCPAEGWNPSSGVRRKRDLTPEQREAMSERARTRFHQTPGFGR